MAKPNIFYSRRVLQPGDIWDNSLDDALVTSKLLMPVFCAPYFYESPWCRTEFMSFVDRHRHLGTPLDDCTNCLIMPILLAGYADLIPKAFRKIQYEDFREFNIPEAIFRQSPLVIEFRRRVRELAQLTIERLKTVPDFDPSFPIKHCTKTFPRPRWRLPRP